MTNTKIEKIDETGVKVSNKDVEKLIKADTIIAATGYKPYNSLLNVLDRTNNETYNLGDSKEVKNIMKAIWDAYEVAKNI